MRRPDLDAVEAQRIIKRVLEGFVETGTPLSLEEVNALASYARRLEEALERIADPDDDLDGRSMGEEYLFARAALHPDQAQEES